MAPPILCIIGKKNAGKTELTVALAGELNRRGFRVMTVKHGHGFRVDQPGKDSWRHRHEGGARRTVMVGPRDFAVVGGWPGEEMSLSEVVRRFLWDAEVVLAEGFKSSPEPKIEVYREGVHAGPGYFLDDPGAGPTLAVVTDDPNLDLPVRVFPLRDPQMIPLLADFVAEVLGLPGPEL